MSKFLKTILGIFIGLLGLTFVITIHEFGHFLACKLFDVSTPIFSIGFDFEIFGHDLILYYKYIYNTKFQIGALPLGGYVSINPYDFATKPYFAKMIIILAGIAINIIFALLVFYYLYKKNQKNKLEIVDQNSTLTDQDLEIPSDLGQENEESQTKEIRKRPGWVQFLIEATPKEAERQMAKQKRDFIGPIGIINLIGKSFFLGFDVFLYFLGLISLNIGLFNLLPIPFFDGGQAASITFQALSDKALPENLSSMVYSLFFLLLIIFTLILVVKDIIGLRKSDND